MTRILGIDPGIARMGYGVIDVQGSHLEAVAFGCIETAAHQPDTQRLYQIYQQLSEQINTHSPAVMAVEQLFFNRNTTTAFTVGQARGVALLCAAHVGLAAVDYTPMQVKLAVTGYGKADKSQVQEMVKVLLGLRERPRPDDTADALAVAITHAHSAAVLTQESANPPAPAARRGARLDQSVQPAELGRQWRTQRGVRP